MLILSVVLAIIVTILFVQLIRYEKELRHMAQFLDERDQDSNTSVKVELRSKGSVELAKAINAEIEEARTERIKDKKRQQELRISLAHLSHDIRTPLTGARGYVQLLQDEEDGALREKYYEGITRRLDDLNYMLNQLFMFTQANDPEHRFEVEKVNANEILSEMLLAFYPEFQEKNFTVGVDFESEACEVLADKEALSRIIQNLLVNALRHGVDSLQITQKGKTFTFSNRVRDVNLIDPERMFERFYKSDSTRSGQGSGLGLAIVAQLTEAMNASVSAELHDDELGISMSFSS